MKHQSNTHSRRGRIEQIVSQTRNERLIDDFELSPDRINQHVRNDEITDPLLGSCHLNAALLAKRFDQNGFNPHVIRGCLAPRSDSVPESIPEAEQSGQVHFWVEVAPTEAATSNTARIVCELAAEPDGGVRVAGTVPDNYHYLPRSRIRYDRDIVNSRQLRNIEGLEYIEESGLIVA
jgi:hypothetical protein